MFITRFTLDTFSFHSSISFLPTPFSHVVLLFGSFSFRPTIAEFLFLFSLLQFNQISLRIFDTTTEATFFFLSTNLILRLVERKRNLCSQIAPYFIYDFVKFYWISLHHLFSAGKFIKNY